MFGKGNWLMDFAAAAAAATESTQVRGWIEEEEMVHGRVEQEQNQAVLIRVDTFFAQLFRLIICGQAFSHQKVSLVLS
jgi:membrane protein required for beta-lactamase induction